MQGRGGRAQRDPYRCESYPCIHIVFDDRRKIFRIFVEDYDYIMPIDVSELREACRILESDPRLKRYREARGEEEDYLARKYLGAEPLSEEE